MFEEQLSSLTVDQLKPRIALLDTLERPTRKADIIALLRTQLVSTRIRAYWEKLTTQERRAVAEAVHNWSGYFEPLRFVKKYGDIPESLQRSTYSSYSTPKPTKSPVLLFFYNGLIPEELRTALRKFVPEPVPDRLASLSDEELPRALSISTHDPVNASVSGDIPVKKLATETIVRHDLPTLLHLVEAGELSVSDKTGVATAACVKRIDVALMGGDFYSVTEDIGLDNRAGGPIRPIRPFAWLLLLQNGGLAKRDGKKLALTTKGKKAATEPFANTVKTLYSRWL